MQDYSASLRDQVLTVVKIYISCNNFFKFKAGRFFQSVSLVQKNASQQSTPKEHHDDRQLMDGLPGCQCAWDA